MYNPPSMRAAMAYRTVGAESSIVDASPHRLIELLVDGLEQALQAALGALARGDLAQKGLQLMRSVRFLEEGLKGGLNVAQGGDLAVKLRDLYDYCINRLTVANLRNDSAAIAEVVSLIAPVAQSWKEIGQTPAAQAA